MLQKNFIFFSMLLPIAFVAQAKTNREPAFSTIGLMLDFGDKDHYEDDHSRGLNLSEQYIIRGPLIRIRQNNQDFLSAEEAIAAITQDVQHLLPFLQMELPKFPQKDCASRKIGDFRMEVVIPAIVISDPLSFKDPPEWPERISTAEFGDRRQPRFHFFVRLCNSSDSGISNTVTQEIVGALRNSIPIGFKGKLNYVLKYTRTYVNEELGND